MKTIRLMLAMLIVFCAMTIASLICSTNGTVHYFNDDNGEIYRIYP